MKVSSKFLNIALLPAVAATLFGSVTVSASPTAAYTQPQPSNQEQYLLELINAARANPAAEGQMLAGITDPEILRYYQHYNVSASQLISQFDSYAAKPPLAFNPDLEASSLEQSSYQASSGVQTHNSANGQTFDARITAAGYHWSGVGENVYAYAEDPFFAHVGLMADWGVPTLDHRENLLNTNPSYPTFREIGISAVPSSVPNFGPLVVTEDFATPEDPTVAYLVGVVYQDANGNGAYDEGEGLGGVTISPDGTNFYAVTTGTGGFVIPLPTSGSGTLTITASGGALGGPRVKTVAYTAGTNVKVDFTTADPVSAAPNALPVVTLTSPAAVALVSGQPGKIQLARGGDLSQPLVVTLKYSGTAVAGVDYSPLPTTLTMPAGAAIATLKVIATENAGSGTKLKVHLGSAAGYTVNSDPAKTQAKIKILAD